MALAVGARVQYRGNPANPADFGTVVAVGTGTYGGAYLIRWDNGLADECLCEHHPMGRVKKDCAGEWFSLSDLHAA